MIGPEDLVLKVLAVSQGLSPAGSWRLVPAADEVEQQAPEQVRRLGGQAEAYLFTGPVPYDLCRQEGVLDRPAVVVPLSGAALYRALLRAALDGLCDIKRLSIDTLQRHEVEEAYAELDLPVQGLRVLEYRGPQPTGVLADFHEQLWRKGTVTAAATCVRSVFEELGRRGVPALRVLPTVHSIRVTLQTALLAAAGSRLEQSQIAISLLDVDGFGRVVRQAPSEYWVQELKLGLQRVLLREAQAVGGTLVPLGSDDFLVVTTLGALQAATDQWRRAPFLGTVQQELGLTLSAGIGLGRSAREAEARAHEALARAKGMGGDRCAVVAEDGAMIAVLTRQASAASPEGSGPQPARGARRQARLGSEQVTEMVRRLVASLAPDAGQPGGPVVGAEEVSRLLAVSARTARRLLQRLVREGYAFPLPPPKSAHPGRPKLRYRLVVPGSTTGRPSACGPAP